jgi:uncharacterized Zn-binding protein involved in type VI secretion
MRPFIVIGDKTDHGGEVVESAPTTDTHGKRIARVGDKVTCPKRGHGPTTFVTGDPTMIIDGKPAARHGDKCACGATLIAQQSVSFTNEGAANAQRSADDEIASALGTKPAPFDFDEQVELITNTALAEGLPYFIKSGASTYSGRVGADLRLPRIDTGSEDTYEVHVGDEALALMMSGGHS